MPKKKRRKPYDGDPIMVTKLPRWGTKAQGKINERERAYKNRIHQLETSLSSATSMLETALFAVRDREDKLEAAAPTRYLLALRAISSISVTDAVSLGLVDHLADICRWIGEIDKPEIDKGASGKVSSQ